MVTNKKNDTPRIPPVTIEDARIIWRNFEGRATQYNDPGNRNFHVVIDDPEVFAAMQADGWNVKEKAPREEDDQPLRHLEVSVGYREGTRPPRVVLITSNGRTDLDADTVKMLDHAQIEKVDLMLNPYQWEVNGKRGIKAYLRSIYVTIVEDDLERKYGGLGQERDEPQYPDDSPF